MIPTKRDTFLGEILVSAGLLDGGGLERGLDHQKETGQLLGEALVSLGLVTQEDIEWALSSQYQLPLIRPKDITVDPTCREMIPEPLAREYHVAPLFRTEDELSVVIDDPLQLERLAALDELGELELNIALASAPDVRELIDELYGELSLDPCDISRPPVESSRLAEADLEPYLRDHSGDALAALLVRRALDLHATSVLLDPGVRFGEARIRTGGVVHETFTLRADWFRTLVRAFWKRTGRAPEGAPTLREAAGHLVLGEEEEVTFTATLVERPEGTAAVIRLPVGPPALPELRDLRLPDGATAKIATLLARRQGLWLVSGHPPAATGRILHALLMAMLGPRQRFLSLREDSRGYERLERFRSLQVVDLPETRAPLEMPAEGEWDGVVLPTLFEREDLELALRTALAGKTVVASMDFPDARSVLRFLLGHGINASLLTSGLAGILVQKEIRILCDRCKKRIDGAGGLPVLAAGITDATAYRPVGCETCRFTGFEGQETLLDFWAMERELKRLLIGPDPMIRLEDYGGTVLEDSCLERLRRGEAVIEDVLSVCEI